MTIDPESIRAAARRIVLEVMDPEENADLLAELVFNWTKSLRFAGMSFEESWAAERELRQAMYEIAGELVAAGGWVEPGEA